jgi:CheY-like chemotaxis protein
MDSTRKVSNILLADDDRDDRFFFGMAITEMEIGIKLEMVKHGEELMEYLMRDDIAMPDILFLDLNMPRKNGFDCLAEIRASAKLRDLFVVIYSTSISQRDVEETFRLGANLFVNKPNSYEDLGPKLLKVFQLNLNDYFIHHNMDKYVLDFHTL